MAVPHVIISHDSRLCVASQKADAQFLMQELQGKEAMIASVRVILACSHTFYLFSEKSNAPFSENPQ